MLQNHVGDSRTPVDARYVPPPPDEAVDALDSLFGSNEYLNFVQRWFGGKALRQRFVEKQLLAYNLRFRNHSRATFIREARCADPDSGPVVAVSHAHHGHPH